MGVYAAAVLLAIVGLGQSQKVLWSQPVWKIGQTPAQMLTGFGASRWSGNSDSRVKIVGDPAGSGAPVLRVEYPKGTYNSNNPGGAGFGGKPFAPQRAAYLSYDLYFDKTFQWNRGGKLPGFYGGGGSCSAGRDSDAQHCFSSRLMWQRSGRGILYFYLTKNQQTTFCQAADVECDFANGRAVFGKTNPSFQFAQGKWHSIKQYVKINDPGKFNGEAKVWIDGKLVVNKAGMAIYADGKGTIDGIAFSTFFGGNTIEWATPVTTYTYYKNFQVLV